MRGPSPGKKIKRKRGVGAHPSKLPTPVRAARLETWLEGYDGGQKQKLVSGFKRGLDVGYKGFLPRVRPHNLTSALQNPVEVDKKLSKESSLNRIVGPFKQEPFSHFRTSPLVLIEKKIPGKFRLINHLSYPPGDSINDGISPEDAQVQYQSIDHALQQLQQLGQGCFFVLFVCLFLWSKTDIADAFRIVSLYPSQYCLFGFVWREQFCYDRCLPMGCSASCKIFETLSNVLQWIASSKPHIRNISRVLDDFLLLARDKAVGQTQLSSFLSMCADIGIPTAPDKTVQPTQVITFLSLELDSVAMEVRLPVDKLNSCTALIGTCLKKDNIQLKPLQSITGTLNFACGAVAPGRPFLRRLINLTIGVTRPCHYIRITHEVREEICRLG